MSLFAPDAVVGGGDGCHWRLEVWGPGESSGYLYDGKDEGPWGEVTRRDGQRNRRTGVEVERVEDGERTAQGSQRETNERV